EYFLYDPFEKRLEGYRLDPERGEYDPMTPDERGWYRSKTLGLWLGVQQGTYHRRDDLWLRWIDDDGRALPSGGDQARQAQAEAQQVQAEAQQVQAEAQQLRERVRVAARALIAEGREPAEVAALFGIGVEELGG
ncbi:MAG TPA: hypothetical protein PLI95_09520, partial [Polyangiaceae bacterium]|nr:hypothetical protein [Polyangiaceae bacterium]